MQNSGDLRNRVGVVGRLEGTGQQGVLADRLLGELRVDARRTQEQQALHPRLPRGVEDVHLNSEVVAQEVHRVGVIGQDAAYLRGGEHDIARPSGGEELEHRPPVSQIQLSGSPGDDVSETCLLKSPDDRGACQTAVARDVEGCSAVEFGRGEGDVFRHSEATPWIEGFCHESNCTASIQWLPACLSASMSESTISRAKSRPSTVASQPSF